MEALRQFMDEHYRVITIAGFSVSAVSVAAIFIRRIQKRRELQSKPYERDVVILHQIGRSPFAPSLTPFAVKLETYLRMARIPYQNVNDWKRSPKGKWPWIEYNGEVVADSSFCVDFLNKTLKIDLNKHLSPPERAIAHAFQKMIEEHLIWCVGLFRWTYGCEQPLFQSLGMSFVTRWLIGLNVKKAAWYQGIGRHSMAEVQKIAHDDLQALSLFLGQKKFLFGDKPCETDCAIFGHLSQIYWQADGTPLPDMIKKEFPNLGNYCLTMKQTFWPDWDQCITHGGTREATK